MSEPCFSLFIITVLRTGSQLAIRPTVFFWTAKKLPLWTILDEHYFSKDGQLPNPNQCPNEESVLAQTNKMGNLPIVAKVLIKNHFLSKPTI